MKLHVENVLKGDGKRPLGPFTDEEVIQDCHVLVLEHEIPTINDNNCSITYENWNM